MSDYYEDAMNEIRPEGRTIIGALKDIQRDQASEIAKLRAHVAALECEINATIEAEREACARIAETFHPTLEHPEHWKAHEHAMKCAEAGMRGAIADAIRARTKDHAQEAAAQARITAWHETEG